MNDSLIFAIKTRAIAKEKGIKIGDLERKLGLSIGYFSRLTDNQKGISFEYVVNVCKEFGMSVEEVMNYKTKVEKLKEDFGDILNNLLTKYSKEEIIAYIKMLK